MQLERKLRFVMNFFTMAQESGIIDKKVEVRTLEQLYYDVMSGKISLAAPNGAAIRAGKPSDLTPLTTETGPEPVAEQNG